MKNNLYKVWIDNLYIGRMKKCFYKLLRYKFGFREWHISPINERDYAIWIVREINRLVKYGKITEGDIVEIGCGIGEIVGNLNVKSSDIRKIGYDLQAEIIPAARLVHPSCKFYQGTFANIRHMKIECLIMVNFLHGMGPEDTKRLVQKVLSNNDIKYIIVDTVYGKGYAYKHDWKEILEDKYCLVKYKFFRVSGNGKRRIEIWRFTERK